MDRRRPSHLAGCVATGPRTAEGQQTGTASVISGISGAANVVIESRASFSAIMLGHLLSCWTQEGTMTRLFIRAATASLALQAMGCGMAQAAEIKMLGAVGVREVMLDLGPKFKRATGHTLAMTFTRAGSSFDESTRVKRSTSS